MNCYFFRISDTTDGDTIAGCRTSCTFMTSIRNPSSNYQVERLNLNRSQTLTNMTIIQTVRRNDNEAHARQYQTFPNSSTNMSYVVNPFHYQECILYKIVFHTSSKYNSITHLMQYERQAMMHGQCQQQRSVANI